MKRTRVMGAMASLIGALLVPMPAGAGVSGIVKCQAAKVKAVGKRIYAESKCYQKSLLKSLPVDPACLAILQAKFSIAVAKADSIGPCSGTVPVLSGVDGCVGTIVGTIIDVTTTTTSTTLGGTTTTMPGQILGCCSNGPACLYQDANTCAQINGVFVASGVCDAATGACVAPPGSVGTCCTITNGATSSCLAGPAIDSMTCANIGVSTGLPATFVPQGTCDAPNVACTGTPETTTSTTTLLGTTSTSSTDPADTTTTSTTSTTDDTSTTTSTTIPQACQFAQAFGAVGAGAGQLSGPTQMSIDTFGNIYVADTGNNRLQKFNAIGTVLGVLGNFGSGPSFFNAPRSIAVDPMGNIIGADTGNDRIQKFDSSAYFLFEVDGLNTPVAVATDAAGDILVVGSFNCRIAKLSPNGQPIWTKTGCGTPVPQTWTPGGIAADAQGNVYVADSGNWRIQKWAADGTFVSSFGTGPGTGDGVFGFAGPKQLSFDASGNLYVADPDNDRIQKFGPNGTFIAAFGTAGTGPGQLDAPSGVVAGPGGLVYVADTDNNRIQKFFCQ